MVRRAVALGVAGLVVIIFVFIVKGCVDSAKEQALKDYTRDVASIVREANDTTGQFFDTLSQGGDSSTDVQTQLNGLRVRAEGHTREARGLDVPDEMRAAQTSLVMSLGLVQGAIGQIAEKIPGALASDSNAAEDAVRAIAGQMQAFTAADVLYQQRTLPYIEQVLDKEEIGGQDIQRSAFQQNLGWLTPSTVARRLNADAAGGVSGGGGSDDGPVAPGLHGHGLVSVQAGDTTLQPGGAANRVTVTSGLAFNVAFANQGTNDENDVSVRVRISGSGSPITASRTADVTKAGAQATISVPLGKTPPIGTAVTVRVEVRPVRGEKKTDNNSQQYTVLFTRG